MSFQSLQVSYAQPISKITSWKKSTEKNAMRNKKPIVSSYGLVYRSLTFKRSVQQGIAAKMSNEYIVPIKSADPSHLSAQKLW